MTLTEVYYRKKIPGEIGDPGVIDLSIDLLWEEQRPNSRGVRYLQYLLTLNASIDLLIGRLGKQLSSAPDEFARRLLNDRIDILEKKRIDTRSLIQGYSRGKRRGSVGVMTRQQVVESASFDPNKFDYGGAPNKRVP